MKFKRNGEKIRFPSFFSCSEIPSGSLHCSIFFFPPKSLGFAPFCDPTGGFYAPDLIGGGAIKAQIQPLDPSPNSLGIAPFCAAFGVIPCVGSAATHWGVLLGGNSLFGVSFWGKFALFEGNSLFWGWDPAGRSILGPNLRSQQPQEPPGPSGAFLGGNRSFSLSRTPGPQQLSAGGALPSLSPHPARKSPAFYGIFDPFPALPGCL